MIFVYSYFSYKIMLLCGIPSVTLEGEKEDWERLYKRLERLPELGTEPGQWAAMLRPILRRFMDAFDGQPDTTFWEHAVHRDSRICGSGSQLEHFLSGWITAFCVWNTKGTWLAGPLPESNAPQNVSQVGASMRSLTASTGECHISSICLPSAHR